ncbi:unnamed protein product, partial [Rotaria sp. Silwood2]
MITQLLLVEGQLFVIRNQVRRRRRHLRQQLQQQYRGVFGTGSLQGGVSGVVVVTSASPIIINTYSFSSLGVVFPPPPPAPARPAPPAPTTAQQQPADHPDNT